MDERLDVIIPILLVFITNSGHFVSMLFTHGLESILFVYEFLNFIIFHVGSEYSTDLPIVLREHTQRRSRCNHDVRPPRKLLQRDLLQEL